MLRRSSFVLLLAAACGGSTQPAASPGVTPPATSTSTPTSTSTSTTGQETVSHVAKVDVPPLLRAAVDAADRDDKDKQLDAGRHPAELLAFAGIKNGMHVAELGAGSGYTTELLARAVGPSGVVYGENSQWVLDRFAQKPWTERLAKPVMKNVVRADREWDDPFPPSAKNLDAVFIVLVYHDTVWLNVDRDKMNRAVFAALRPGGTYIIVDHAAKAGSGTGDVKTLHRIDEATVIDEVTKAGFKLAAEGDFLRNASDARDWNDAPMAAAEKRGTSDRFVLKFMRP